MPSAAAIASSPANAVLQGSPVVDPLFRDSLFRDMLRIMRRKLSADEAWRIIV
jgi:hypothetical protein